ncbi:MAG: TPM domain-containing protein [Eubacteriales bacterium]|nr:TPM domain-containing protein [Eubacteriales bacterium]
MKNRKYVFLLFILLFAGLLSVSFMKKQVAVNASEASTTSESSTEISPDSEQGKQFDAIIEDGAGLLSEGEKEMVEKSMHRFSNTCHVAFLTRKDGEGTAKAYTDAFYKKYWPKDESVIFMIDYVEGVVRCGHYALDQEAIDLEESDFQEIIDEIMDDVNNKDYAKAGTQFFKKFAFKVFGEEAENIEKTSEEGYEIIVHDQAGLLTEDQQETLTTVMEPIAAYGHVVFLTTDHNDASARDYCKSYFENRWNKDSAVILLIDMDNRVIRIESFGYGQLYDMITESYANTITDNVYKYAREKDYNECARSAFTQINQILEGKRIAQPMKYICNALLALISAVIIIFIYVKMRITQKAPSSYEMLDYIDYYCNINEISRQYLNKTKNKVKSSSGSSSSSGGFWSDSSSGSSWGSLQSFFWQSISWWRA